MTTVEERVSRLEGAYEHLATQAQLAQLKGDFQLMAQQVEMLAHGVAGLRETVAGAIARLDDLENSGPSGSIGFRSQDRPDNT